MVEALYSVDRSNPGGVDQLPLDRHPKEQKQIIMNIF